MKIFESITIMFILLFIGFEILYDSENVINSVSLSLDIFKNNVFPSMFPFFVFSKLLLNYGFAELFGNMFKGVINKLFGVSGKCAFIIFMSIISGNPSNAKYTLELYLNGDIDNYDVLKVLCFSSFVSPLFIFGFVGSLLNKKTAILILLCHYIGNFITGILIRNYHASKYDKSSIKLGLKQMHEKRINNDKFGVVFTNSIVDSINCLFLILGVITSCFVLTNIINNVFNLSGFLKDIINGLIEMTQGIKLLCLDDINFKLKATMTVFLLSFGGLSIHLQIMGILSDIEFKYFPFFFSRIFSSFASSFIFYILFDVFIKL